MSGYGICLAQHPRPRYAQCGELLLEAHGRLKAAGQEREERMRDVVAALAHVCDQTDRPAEAAKWRAELSVLRAATQPSSPPRPSTRPPT
jgi:hypothetical protein